MRDEERAERMVSEAHERGLQYGRENKARLLTMTADELEETIGQASEEYKVLYMVFRRNVLAVIRDEVSSE